MKKFTFLKSIAAIMGLLIMISMGCSKVELHDKTINKSQYEMMTAEDINVMSKIIAFREKLVYHRDNPYFKSGEVMSAEEARWNIETLFNVTYGFPYEKYGMVIADSAIIYLPVNSSGEVLLDDAISIYEDIIILVSQCYHSSAFEDKGFLLLTVKTGEIVNGQIELVLLAVTGEKSAHDPNPPAQWEPFEDSANWWYGQNKGKCNWSNPGTDAAKEIQNFLNTTKPIPPPPPTGYRYVYVTDTIIEKFGHEYEDENGNHLIFYIEDENGNFSYDDYCLDSEELNFHYFGQREVIYTRIPQEENKPDNWVLFYCKLTGKSGTSVPNPDYKCLRHFNKLEYAYRYIVPIVDIGEPVELEPPNN
ncbi:MAG TPA: hypothetical protein PLH40_06595 [Bacteroidales bacterium]|nr:hypothetical protein [Bacteroidales bacterium]